jgi:hypothetical protein
MEVRETGPNHDACTLAQLGVPGKVAIVLARGIAGGEFCDNPTAYAEARALWILGRCSALTELTNGLQGWQYVATSLQGGEPAYGGNPTGYKLAISELRQILAIAKSGTVMYGPGWENGNTYTSSNPSFKIDILRLNSFFKTPGVYLQDASTMICGTS